MAPRLSGSACADGVRARGARRGGRAAVRCGRLRLCHRRGIARRSTGEPAGEPGGRQAPGRRKNLRSSAFWGIPEPPFYDSIAVVDAALDALPDDVETLKQALLSARTQVQEALVQTALVAAEKDAVAAELAVAK